MIKQLTGEERGTQKMKVSDENNVGGSFISLEEVREIAIFLYDKFCDEDADDWDMDMSIMKYIPKDR